MSEDTKMSNVKLNRRRLALCLREMANNVFRAMDVLEKNTRVKTSEHPTPDETYRCRLQMVTLAERLEEVQGYLQRRLVPESVSTERPPTCACCGLPRSPLTTCDRCGREDLCPFCIRPHEHFAGGPWTERTKKAPPYCC